MAMHVQGLSGVCLRLVLLTTLIYLGEAGRAFPQKSENFVQELFNKINPSLKWDPSNFLVDLAGRYALCRSARRRGAVKVEGWLTEEGSSIAGLTDYTPGQLSHVGAVHEYLTNALPVWLDASPYKDQILHAHKFGCSVQPRCKGFVIFTCLFSPAYGDSGRTTPKPDTDECLRGNAGCQHMCTNIPGSYFCSCFQGYTLQSDRHTCLAEDNDECALNNGGCDHICHNTPQSYYCSCRAGYVLQADRETCLQEEEPDENECARNNGGCQHVCHNTIGSFYCSCRPGYALAPDRKSCRDIDECRTNNGGCDHVCANVPGSYYCSCRQGYTLQPDRRTCLGDPPPVKDQHALAFTRQEYDLAEGVTGTKWDRSHFLENLSGYETDCRMIGKNTWTFDYAKQEAVKWKYEVDGLFGYVHHGGSTSDSIIDILDAWPSIPTKEVGCSVIPDCPRREGGLYVVVSCIFRIPQGGFAVPIVQPTHFPPVPEPFATQNEEDPHLTQSSADGELDTLADDDDYISY